MAAESVIVSCPMCGAPIKLDLESKLKLHVDLETEEHLRVKGLRMTSPLERERWILEAIDPYISEDVTRELLEKVLREEFFVCRAHLPGLVQKISEVYGLFSPDGKRLCSI